MIQYDFLIKRRIPVEVMTSTCSKPRTLTFYPLFFIESLAALEHFCIKSPNYPNHSFSIDKILLLFVKSFLG